MSAEAGTRIASIGAATTCASLETWQTTGKTLFETLSDRSWQVADWLSAGIDAWGIVATSHAAEISGFNRGKISNYKTVSKAFTEFRRRNTLSFSHHLEVARLPEAEQDRLLDAAESGKWTRGQLREAVREVTGEIEADRLRARLAELEHELAAERMDGQAALKASKNMERTVAAVAKRIVADYGEIADSLAEWRAGPAWQGLHGNARRAMLMRLASTLRRTAADAEALAAERIVPALTEEDGG